MKLEPRNHGDVLIIEVNEPRVDAAVAIQFKDAVRDLSANGPERVVLDMKAVDFLDSSGLGAVVAAMKQLGSARKLELAALTPNVKKVFRLTRMDTVFCIHPDAESALGAIAKAS